MELGRRRLDGGFGDRRWRGVLGSNQEAPELRGRAPLGFVLPFRFAWRRVESSDSITTMRSLQQAADRAVLDWVVDGKKSKDALEDIRASVAERGVRCVVVEVASSPSESRTRSSFGDEDGDAELLPPEVVESLFVRSGMRRVLATSRQLEWREVFEGLTAERGAHWLAAEPISGSGGSVFAMLVVVGSTPEPDDDVLLALPAVAKGCGPLILQRRADDLSSRRRHTMNNLLATVSANLGYVADLLEESAERSAASPSSLGDAQKALGNARSALREIGVQVEVLTGERRSSII